MDEAIRIENKRRQELRLKLAKQRLNRLEARIPVSASSHIYHIAKGTRKEAVLDFLQEGGLYTIPEIGNALGFKHTSVAALIRDLRKAKNGSHVIDVVRIDGDHYFQFIR
jgi:hypothetical protein